MIKKTFIPLIMCVTSSVLLLSGCGEKTKQAATSKSVSDANVDAPRKKVEKPVPKTYIVKDGKPLAEIVVSPDPKRPRMVALAALELQRVVEMMSGARLPIVTRPGESAARREPTKTSPSPATKTDGSSAKIAPSVATRQTTDASPNSKTAGTTTQEGSKESAKSADDGVLDKPPVPELPVKIYVGESEYAKKLGVTAEGLSHGAFRMVSGPDYLVLLGADVDFTPLEPWARNNSDRKRAQKEWDELTVKLAGGKWGHPFKSTYKAWWNPSDYDDFMAKRYGADDKHVYNPSNVKFSKEYQGSGAGAGFWAADEGGTFNAVCEFLRSQGVRWYMPDENGEVVPKKKSIGFEPMNETVKPDFKLRSWNWYNFGAFPFEHIIWAWHLGMSSTHGVLGAIGYAHGLSKTHQHKDLREAHPEYYALKNGERVTDYRNMGHVCFSSDALFNETLRFARFMFDHYDQPHVSIWPVDGFKKCECASCRKLSSSDLVWGFVDRVARELYKTHPDRIVSCGAYTPYIHPPKNVKKFPPNAVVFMANCGRPLMDDPIRWESYQARVKGWQEKMAPGNVMRCENNRFGLGRKFPVIHPRCVAKDLKALKGISSGDCGEQSQSGGRWNSPGYDHLTLYVQSRMLWDVDQDVDAIIEEYYDKFYGPASDEMRAALEFAQTAYSRTDGSRNGGRCNPRNATTTDRVKFGELLLAARQKAGDTVYGKRIQVILDEFLSYASMEELRAEASNKIDKSDPWADIPAVSAWRASNKGRIKTHELKELMGRKADVKTEFSVMWDRKELVFDVRCEEPDMTKIKTPGRVWEGDSVIILLESPSHSYYEIQINPNGEVHDAKHFGGGRVIPRWDSHVEVDTEKGTDFWRVKAQIPIALVGAEGAEGDPFNFVIGPEVAPGGKWFFNVGRHRPRDGVKTNKTEQVFAPTGAWSIFNSGKSSDASDAFARLDIR